jgi:hypothetical protein
MAFSVSEFDSLLKQMYFDDWVETMLTEADDDPFYNAVTRVTDAGGNGVKVPVITSANIRVSNDFAEALALGDNQKSYAFTVTGVEVYSIASWTTKVLRQSSGTRKAFVEAIDLQMDAAAKALAHKVCTQLYRGGTGSVTTVASDATLASVYLKLANASDVQMFEVGDKLSFSQTDGGSLRSGTATITNIDATNGRLQFASYASGSVTGLAVGDYIYRSAGDAQDGGTKVAIDGYLSWVPATSTPQTATFHGLNRASYTSKLQGLFYDNSTLEDPIDQCLIKAASILQTNARSQEGI